MMNVQDTISDLILKKNIQDITDVKNEDALSLIEAYAKHQPKNEILLGAVCEAIIEGNNKEIKIKACEKILNDDYYGEYFSIIFDKVYVKLNREIDL